MTIRTAHPIYEYSDGTGRDKTGYLASQLAAVERSHREEMEASVNILWGIWTRPKTADEVARIRQEMDQMLAEKENEFLRRYDILKKGWNKSMELAKDLKPKVDRAGCIIGIEGQIKQQSINLDFHAEECPWEILGEMIIRAHSKTEKSKYTNKRHEFAGMLENPLVLLTQQVGTLNGICLDSREIYRIASRMYYPLLCVNCEEILEKRMRFAEAKATVLGE